MKVLQENGLKAFMTSILNKFIKKTDTEQVNTIDIDTTPTAGSNNLITSGGVASAISSKANKPTISNQTAPTTITVADNTEYYLTNVGNLTITFPSGNFECYISLTTASTGAVNITLPTTNYIGDKPTFLNNETWEISIKNGIIVAGKVGVAQ